MTSTGLRCGNCLPRPTAFELRGGWPRGSIRADWSPPQRLDHVVRKTISLGERAVSPRSAGSAWITSGQADQPVQGGSVGRHLYSWPKGLALALLVLGEHAGRKGLRHFRGVGWGCPRLTGRDSQVPAVHLYFHRIMPSARSPGMALSPNRSGRSAAPARTAWSS